MVELGRSVAMTCVNQLAWLTGLRVPTLRLPFAAKIAQTEPIYKGRSILYENIVVHVSKE